MYDFEHSIKEDRYIAIGCVGGCAVCGIYRKKRKYQVNFSQIGNGSKKETLL